MTIEEQIDQALANLLPGLLGIKIESAAPDEVVGTLVVEERLCTVGGILHGGAFMALADTLGGVGAFLNLTPRTRTATVESKTNFLRPAKIGTKVTAKSRLINRGRTLLLWQTEVHDSEGRLLALVSQSQMIVPVTERDAGKGA
jgi:1,4-dihydroxy-2-naphthoyl-CoA hydrolase